MLFTLSRPRLLQALDQALGIGRNAQQVCRLLQRLVVGAGEKHGISPARCDLDRRPVVIDLLDEREQVLPRLARGDRHPALPLAACTINGTTAAAGAGLRGAMNVALAIARSAFRWH